MKRRITPVAPPDRRKFLRQGLALTAGVLLPGITFAVTSRERRLAFRHLHTGERLDLAYWANGDYIQEALTAINHQLRDHRSGEIHAIDPALLDSLYRLRQTVDSNKPFQVISGYRSPKTNRLLRAKSKGVAKRSLHMQGKAIDIRLPGIDIGQLRQAAISLQAGGVGLYRKSNFIHLDTGRVRYW
jgi:uncharacterized protein YcbK (DUF882 family)